MAQPMGASTTSRAPVGAVPADDTERSREPSRDRILAVALEEFADKGFDGATTAEIARRADVTQPLVHYHFASKDELWRAALRPMLEQLTATFAGQIGELRDLDPVSRLKVLVRRFVAFSAANPELGRIMAYEGAKGGPRLEWLVEQDAIAQLSVFGQLLGDASRDGLVKPLPPQHVGIALGAAAAYIFVIRQTMARGYDIDVTDPEVVARHADTVVEVFFHGLVADQDGGR